MIGGGGIGASPMVRPFYNRGGGAPVVPIVRTAVGKSLTASAGGVSVVTVGPFDYAAGDTIVVCMAYYDPGAAASYSLLVDGDPLDLDGGAAPGGGLHVAELYSYRVASALVGVSVVLDCSLGGSLPTAAGLIVSKVTGLKASGTYLDVQAINNGTGTNQDSGLTSTTTTAQEYAHGFICTAGVSADAVGTWQASFTAGQNQGSASTLRPLVMKEGYRILSATGQQRAQVTGATSRPWGACCATYLPA